MPNLAQSHSPGSTAAYAVPLSLAGAVVLVASMVCAIQRRKLLHERTISQEESKIFQGLFGGRLVGFHTSHSGESSLKVHQSGEFDDEEKESPTRGSDIFTRPYVPHLHKHRQPRIATKEPFSSTATGRATVPASYFKTSLSPRVPYAAAYTPGTERGYLPRTARADSSKEVNAAVNEDVVANYLQPSPVPPSLSPAPMHQAHLRKQISSADAGHKPENMKRLYEEVARRLT